MFESTHCKKIFENFTHKGSEIRDERLFVVVHIYVVVQPGSDRYKQSGIAAWRIGCGAEGNPGTYADVAFLRNWIDEKVSAHGYTTQSYSIV